MKATFPVRSFPWAHYAPAALFCVAATVIGLVLYDGLPERLATRFHPDGAPAGWMAKRAYLAFMSGSMWGVLALFLGLDRLLVYRSFPVSVMSAGAGAAELYLLSLHLGSMKVYELEGTHVSIILGAGFALFLVYMAVHLRVTRTIGEEPGGTPLWIDHPPHSFLDTVFFLARPLMPNEVRAHEEGLVLKARLYAFAVPWGTIESVTRATRWEAIAGWAQRMASNPSRAVKLKLSGMKPPLIFSIDDEERLIAEWESRRAKPSE